MERTDSNEKSRCSRWCLCVKADAFFASTCCCAELTRERSRRRGQCCVHSCAEQKQQEKEHKSGRRIFSSSLDRRYIDSHVPHIKEILNKDIDEVIEESELVVIGNNNKLYIEYIRNLDKPIIDLAGIGNILTDKKNYIGINW